MKVIMFRMQRAVTCNNIVYIYIYITLLRLQEHYTLNQSCKRVQLKMGCASARSESIRRMELHAFSTSALSEDGGLYSVAV
jgi:hypothetical protein